MRKAGLILSIVTSTALAGAAFYPKPLVEGPIKMADTSSPPPPVQSGEVKANNAPPSNPPQPSVSTRGSISAHQENCGNNKLDKGEDCDRSDCPKNQVCKNCKCINEGTPGPCPQSSSLHAITAQIISVFDSANLMVQHGAVSGDHITATANLTFNADGSLKKYGAFSSCRGTCTTQAIVNLRPMLHLEDQPIPQPDFVCTISVGRSYSPE